MRKRIKRGVAILLAISLITSALLLSGCVGYNKLMRKHLSDADNYYEFILELEGIETIKEEYDSGERYLPVESAADIDLDGLVCLFVTCKVLYSSYHDEDWSESPPSIVFEISRANTEYLLDTDFFNVVKAGDVLNARSSWWIYMDTDFNYLAEISLNDLTYLPFERGLQNIIDYMNANKSLL